MMWLLLGIGFQLALDGQLPLYASFVHPKAGGAVDTLATPDKSRRYDPNSP